MSAKEGRVRTTCDDAGGEVNELQSVGAVLGSSNTQGGPWPCEPNIGIKTEYTPRQAQLRVGPARRTVEGFSFIFPLDTI